PRSSAPPIPTTSVTTARRPGPIKVMPRSSIRRPAALAAALLALAAAPVPALAADPIQPAMGEVSDGDNRLRLFCSFGFRRPHTVWRTPVLEAALAEAERVYFRTLSRTPPAERAPELIGPFGALPDGLTLDQLLAPEHWASVEQAATAGGISLDSFKPMAPWL